MSDTPELSVRLDHLNLPARKPEWLAEWYAETFGFKAEGGFVLGAGAVIVFEAGEPLVHHGKPLFGFRADTREQVQAWAKQLAVTLEDEAVYCGFSATDPEGYVFNAYWEAPAS